MPLELVTLPCLKDNYVFLIHDAASGATAVVDVPDAAPVLAALAERGWTLTDILLTHHHWDHIDGVADLRAATGAKIWGAAADAHRLPPLDVELTEGDTVPFAGELVRVIDVSGHTVGHIAYHFPDSGLVFTGDSLMAMGCGRLFEGTPAQMWQSLSKLAALPDETLVCSGHEYTCANMRFALTLEPANQALILRSKAIETARRAGLPTVPSTLALERQTNPFLRAPHPEMKATLGMSGAEDAAVFAEIRARKDKF
ncbi:MAG: hydroxyacylglutathione hydrolase [Paracoccaceae bacterium]|nr:hydroxyacylglutathione hydrolase [Paracoccaceae bacterium]